MPLAQKFANLLTLFLVCVSILFVLVALKTKHEHLILVCSWSTT